ncbi:Extracellular metalloproteinase mep [Paramyrothecium foliicola]|nr:Extracellular metalloproteinase mep [Paramyrothecium foliicola]
MIKSLALLGLAATVLPAPSLAHPRGHSQSRRSPSKWIQPSVNANRYPMPALSAYTNSLAEEEQTDKFRIASSASYVETATKFAREQHPELEFRLVPDHYIGKNGIGHVHLKQQIYGLDLLNGDFKINVGRDGSIFSHGNSFFTGELPLESTLTNRDFITPDDALRTVIEAMGLDIQADKVTVEPIGGGTPEKYVIRGVTGSRRDPEARLLYLNGGQSEVHLAWQVQTEADIFWYTTYVDAMLGEQILGVVDGSYRADATYKVYPWGVNDPDDGERVILQNPWLLSSSPYGWHSNGTENFTTTQGNNGVGVHDLTAVVLEWEKAYQPNSPDLAFEYPYNPGKGNQSASVYRDASITQLFYTSNMFHDVLYEMGFTEEAGNFQANNGEAGGLGNDFLLLSAQDSWFMNNAVFIDAPDGESPAILMFLWDWAWPEVRDSVFDIGVILHEFTHGLSLRLTGGRLNYGCLSSLEARGMGEGWSDFMPTAIRLRDGDTRETDYSMGAWITNDPRGIRSHPYSTNMETNPLTYQSVRNITGIPHAVGTVWATMLYEVMWNLIDDHGLNAWTQVPQRDEEGVPTDGKFLAMQLVMDGLALQPCQPSIVAARDAIIDADRAWTGGKNACALWKAFAKRGLGEGARPGVYVNDFTVPDGVCIPTTVMATSIQNVIATVTVGETGVMWGNRPGLEPLARDQDGACESVPARYGTSAGIRRRLGRSASVPREGSMAFLNWDGPSAAHGATASSLKDAPSVSLAEGADTRVTLPEGWKYKSKKLGGHHYWYASPRIQLLLVSIVCFLCPGMFNALSGLGGGGQVDGTAQMDANTALYSTFAVVGFFAGSIANRIGLRFTLSFGGIGYCVYAASFLAYNHTQNRGFVVFAGAFLGVCAGLLWTAQGAVMMAYPPEHEKGRYISWFWVIFNMGAVIGALIPLAQNINNSTGTVNDGTYAALIVLMFLGAVLALGLCNAANVIREDGSHIIMKKNPSWSSELIGLWETIRDEKWILLLFPMFFTSNVFYTYQTNGMNLMHFNVRTRALNSLLYWLAQIVGALVFGYALDMPNIRRSVRAKVSYVTLTILTFAIWGGGWAWQKDQLPREKATQDIDWTDGARYIGPMFLYFFYGFFDAVWQTCIYWYMGALSNSSRKAANLAGFYKGIQSAGAAIWWALDSRGTSYDTIFFATWGLLAGALLIGSPVIFLKIKDTTEVIEDIAGTGTELAEAATAAQLEAEEKKSGAV